jgi:Flp pilus assembly pilin Flp
MHDLATQVRDDEQGMTTAEYAVGTVAVAGLGGVLIKLLASQEVRDLLWSLFTEAFSFLF